MSKNSLELSAIFKKIFLKPIFISPLQLTSRSPWQCFFSMAPSHAPAAPSMPWPRGAAPCASAPCRPWFCRAAHGFSSPTPCPAMPMPCPVVHPCRLHRPSLVCLLHHLRSKHRRFTRFSLSPCQYKPSTGCLTSTSPVSPTLFSISSPSPSSIRAKS